MKTKLLLYFNTLKYLKFKQIFYRVFYQFYKPFVSCIIKNNKIRINEKTDFIAKKQVFFIDSQAIFLNCAAKITNAKIWNDPEQEKLWLYNLHYFDALNAADADQKKLAYELLERWIDENPPFIGVGWEPYPISLRIVNVIKYALSGNKLSEKIDFPIKFLKVSKYVSLTSRLFISIRI